MNPLTLLLHLSTILLLLPQTLSSHLPPTAPKPPSKPIAGVHPGRLSPSPRPGHLLPLHPSQSFPISIPDLIGTLPKPLPPHSTTPLTWSIIDETTSASPELQYLQDSINEIYHSSYKPWLTTVDVPPKRGDCAVVKREKGRGALPFVKICRLGDGDLVFTKEAVKECFAVLLRVVTDRARIDQRRLYQRLNRAGGKLRMGMVVGGEEVWVYDFVLG